jgi:hypothetical protein
MASERTTSAPFLPSNRVKLVVASSVMLTFISFWRAAAVVLNDLGSSAFYAGGIAEEAVALLFCGARRLRGELFDVHPRRRVSRGEGGFGRHLRQAERFRAHV